MFVWIDGTRLRGDVKPSGQVLTVKITDTSKAPEEILALLCSAKEIRKLNAFGSVQAVYKGKSMTSATLETVAGSMVITACLQAENQGGAELEQIKAQLSEQEMRMRTVEEQTGKIAAIGVREERVQSDKLGFDFVRHYIGDVLMLSRYEPQENPQGTAENPIPWTEEVVLIPNAFYTLDGVRKVWMGEAGAQSASWDDERWEVF